MPLPHDPGPHWGEVGIHGLHRQREWDQVATVDVPGLDGDEAWFVALADGRVLSEEGLSDPSRLAAAVTLPPPFRARAIRREAALWVVAATRIETVELADDPGGDAVELVWDGVERSVRIGEAPTLAGLPELERLGASRHEAYVVRATRLDGSTWEVSVAAL
ncbi:MAG TPA: hypothetical protein VHH57_03770 [Gaiella sp.]|nr:hypothetical protein [Gaiella sp.]